MQPYLQVPVNIGKNTELPLAPNVGFVPGLMFGFSKISMFVGMDLHP
jgi:hypothetical protein